MGGRYVVIAGVEGTTHLNVNEMASSLGESPTPNCTEHRSRRFTNQQRGTSDKPVGTRDIRGFAKKRHKYLAGMHEGTFVFRVESLILR